jgi:hypothetical protein
MAKLEVTQQMRRSGELFLKITKMVEGEDGAAALTAIAYALVACANVIGVSKEQIHSAIDSSWDTWDCEKGFG